MILVIFFSIIYSLYIIFKLSSIFFTARFTAVFSMLNKESFSAKSADDSTKFTFNAKKTDMVCFLCFFSLRKMLSTSCCNGGFSRAECDFTTLGDCEDAVSIKLQ